MEQNSTALAARIVYRKNNVSYKVRLLAPEGSQGMRFVPVGAFKDNPVAYYHMGMVVGRRENGKSLIMNIHFFGLEPEDLGRTHTFRVEVWVKQDGAEQFTGISLYKDPDAKSEYNLKFYLDNRAPCCIPILGAPGCIVFQPRVAKEMAAA
ncbi:MAG TPA: hypothetical protein VMD74_04920 [Candidatus Methylomirabilis sp.]|nr:hypothetical protein [Candidatus Methylomirabilis sp.]